MADSIESNIVSRRRVLFETSNDTKQIPLQLQANDQLLHHPYAYEVQPPSSVGASPSAQKSDDSIQFHGGAPAAFQAMQAPNLILAKSVPVNAVQKNSNFEQGAVMFADYTGCFTDDGSPLIEQQSLSEPLLKRDRQLNLGPIANAATTSPPQGFSLASQQLLLQQQQLQQQINQQQLHIQKLNISLLQDSTASLGVGNGRDGLLTISSIATNATSNTHAQLPVNSKIEAHESRATSQLRPESASQLEVSSKMLPKKRCFVFSLMFRVQEAMRHFLQFREASLKKMHMLEQENTSLKTRLYMNTTKTEMPHDSGDTNSSKELEKRLVDMKMSFDQQILDLQVCSTMSSVVLISYFFTETSCYRKQPLICARSGSGSAKACLNFGHGAGADSGAS
jgi:hypothetical protein